MNTTRPSHHSDRLGVLAILGIFGQAVFVVVVALLPFFQPEYDSFDEPISKLLIGPYGFIQSGAFFAAGLGSLALAVGIRRTTRGVRGSLLGCVLIGIWALGFTLAGIMLTDAEGKPMESVAIFHGVVGGLAFLFAPAGMLVLSGVFAREGRWSSFYPLSLAVAFAAVVALIDGATIAVGLSNLVEALGPVARRELEGLGVIQRVFVATVILWMMLAGARLRSVARKTKGTGSAPRAGEVS